MPCYHPLKGYRAKTPNPSGKYSITFNPALGYKDLPVELPCGRCIGCRLERSRQWAIRCVHEAQLHEDNCFITLTYDESKLPPNGSLVVKDFQDFMKRLRAHASDPYSKLTNKLKSDANKNIRFFHCGEYGEKTYRPHYHACLFNLDFADRVKHSERNGHVSYTSETLTELWPYGHSIIGNLTFESAAYVARYITKKQTGPGSEIYYENIDLNTGEYQEKKREYVTMSRRPGIGKAWLEKYKTDVYPHNYVVIRGKKMKPPKFYNRQYEITDPNQHAVVKAVAKGKAQENPEEKTWDRLEVKEYIQLEKAKQLIRVYEK